MLLEYQDPNNRSSTGSVIRTVSSKILREFAELCHPKFSPFQKKSIREEISNCEITKAQLWLG